MLTRRTTVWNTQLPTYHPIYSSQDKYVYMEKEKDKYEHKDKEKEEKNALNTQHSPYHLLSSYQPPIYSFQDKDKDKREHATSYYNSRVIYY